MAPKNEKPLHSLIAGATAGGIEAYAFAVSLFSSPRLNANQAQLRYVPNGIRENEISVRRKGKLYTTRFNF